MRAPRILIWASARDRNSRLPSPGWRTRSPVRYRRCPGRDGSGSATNRPAVRPGRPRYPRATPTPLIYSSPPAPAGTGTSPSSRILSPTDGSGVPIGRCRRSSSPAPAGSRKNVELHVASVTPYTFISGTPRLRHIASRPGSPRSLPTIPSRSDDGSARPARSSSRTHSCQYAAGSSITLTCSRPASSARSAPRPPGRRGGNTTAPPASHTGNSSSASTSNPGDANCRNRSPAPSCSRCPTSRANAASDPCSTTTPLGSPVDPDVYTTYAGHDAPGTTPAPPPAPPAAPAPPPSTSTAGTPDPSASTASAPVVTSTAAPESPSMNRTRSAGYCGSSGTYAAPAISTPSTATASDGPPAPSTPPRSPRPRPPQPPPHPPPPRPRRPQPTRQPPRQPRKLPVTHRHPVAHHRHSIRRQPHLTPEQLHHPTPPRHLVTRGRRPRPRPPPRPSRRPPSPQRRPPAPPAPRPPPPPPPPQTPRPPSPPAPPPPPPPPIRTPSIPTA